MSQSGLWFFISQYQLLLSFEWHQLNNSGSNDDQVSEEDADMKTDESQKSENGTDKEGKLSYATGYTGWFWFLNRWNMFLWSFKLWLIEMTWTFRADIKDYYQARRVKRPGTSLSFFYQEF